MSDPLTSPSPSVLVLGARGRFGQAAARAFASKGWRVFAQVRPGAGTTPDIPSVHWLRLDPQDTAALLQAAAGSAVVVHGLNPVYTRRAWEEQVPVLNAAAIRAAQGLGATLMQPANVYNFGDTMPALLREDSPQRPTTVKGRVRVAGERQIEQAAREGSMKAVLIRAGDFFGSGTGSWLDLVMVKHLQRGRFTHPGALDVPTAWAYLPDLASTFVRVAEHREQLGTFESLNFAGYSATGRQWADVLSELAHEQGWLARGSALKIGRVPWSVLGVAGLFMPQMASLFEMRYLWRTPHALANDRLSALIGREPHTPFADAVRRAVLNQCPARKR